MNDEELKKLKPGDEIFIRARYKKVLDDGDVLFTHSARLNCDEVVETHSFSHPETVILPSDLPPAPKYDPCRLFKKGDKVKRRTVDGRTDQEMPEGIELTVTCGEDKYGNVRVQSPNGISIVTKSVFLELVTPVEELEPYSVEVDEDEDEWHILRGVKFVMSFHFDSDAYYTEEQAKAAAEAECARLNAEYRKEQK